MKNISKEQIELMIESLEELNEELSNQSKGTLMSDQYELLDHLKLVRDNFVLDLVSGWIPLMENKNLFDREAKHNCKVLFDDGTECDYDDPHPLAMLTHFKISYR